MLHYPRLSAGFVLTVVFAARALFVPAVAVAEDIVLFPYFQGNGETGVYLSYSTDGRTFLPLNNAQPIFVPPQWPNGQNLTRDPSIVFRDGKFHMVWTSNWSGRIFGYANSPDLVTWSTPLQVTPFPASLPAADQPNNVWAPEIHFDQIQGDYQIVFSSTTPRELGDGDGSQDSHGSDHRLFEVRTTDFQTFTPAEALFDQNFSVIDGQMAFDNRGTSDSGDDRWVMAIKRETDPPGGKNIRLTFTSPAQTNPWSAASAPILGPGSSLRANEQVEGPSLIRFGNEWLLYADAYTSGHYSLISSPDLTAWSDETAELSFPVAHPRHGTALVVERNLVGWRFGPRSDLDNDGLIDAADWIIFRTHHLAELSGLSPLEQSLRGDLNGDGRNDIDDFVLFKSDYIAAHGEAAFFQMLAVPEPSTMVLAISILSIYGTAARTTH